MEGLIAFFEKFIAIGYRKQDKQMYYCETRIEYKTKDGKRRHTKQVNENLIEVSKQFITKKKYTNPSIIFSGQQWIAMDFS
ncbi:MAG: hypothetical protein KA120_02570 [Candidatus Goldbacteria bacterium]|nr:hypothetical protein [Candidatus Goldiibacteriota bacterium]